MENAIYFLWFLCFRPKNDLRIFLDDFRKKVNDVHDDKENGKMPFFFKKSVNSKRLPGSVLGV